MQRNIIGFRTKFASGVTLVELLVTLGVIGILVGLLLPAIQAAREQARVFICRDKIRQLAIAAHLYEQNNRRFPCGHEGETDYHPFQPWTAKLLPFLEHQQLSEDIDSAYQITSNPFNQTIHQHFNSVVPRFACPSDERVSSSQVARGIPAALTSFVGVNGTNQQARDGIFYFRSRTRIADITDGLSNTLAFIERPPSRDFYFGWWYAGYGDFRSGNLDSTVGTAELNLFSFAHLGASCPHGPYRLQQRTLLDAQCGIFHPWSLHSVVNIARADGSVQGIPYGTEEKVLVALGTRSGGEVESLNE